MRFWIGTSLVLLIAVFVTLQSWGVNAYLAGLLRPGHLSTPTIPSSEEIHLGAADAKRSAVLVHGLNFDAKGMTPLGMEFAKRNFEVFIPRLLGHRGDLQTTKEVFDFHRWLAQIEHWPKAQSPRTCVGYSLGGLFLVTAALHQKIECQSFILFAPALALKTPRRLVRTLQWLLPLSFEVPTGIPAGYFHFERLGLSTTYGTYDLMEEFERNIATKKNLLAKIPALILIDDRDEIVDAQELKEILKTHLPKWKIKAVRADNRDSNGHHLIVDEAHLGSDAWIELLNSIKSE